jgi:hypothetical protein
LQVGQFGEARIRHRRKLRRGDETLGVRHRENPQLSGAVKSERLTSYSYHGHRNLSADQVGYRRSGTAVGHLDEFGQPRQQFEQLAGQLGRRPDADMPIGQLAGMGRAARLCERV